MRRLSPSRTQRKRPLSIQTKHCRQTASKPRRERLVAHSAPDAERLDRLEHVMDTDDLNALLHGLEREGDASAQAFVDWTFVRKRTNGALAARADYHWQPSEWNKASP